jgi:hypothetical protein
MAEDWIKTLADRIKEIDGGAAAAEQERSRCTDLIRSCGPSFFEALLTAVDGYARALLEVLGKDVTAGSISLARQGDSVTLTRPAFPYFEGRLSLDLSGQAIKLSYFKENPKRTNIPLVEVRQAFRFTAGVVDMLAVESDSAVQPLRFESPAELAKHVAQALFSV